MPFREAILRAARRLEFSLYGGVPGNPRGTYQTDTHSLTSQRLEGGAMSEARPEVVGPVVGRRFLRDGDLVIERVVENDSSSS